jgi:hypothetical protein
MSSTDHQIKDFSTPDPTDEFSEIRFSTLLDMQHTCEQSFSKIALLVDSLFSIYDEIEITRQTLSLEIAAATSIQKQAVDYVDSLRFVEQCEFSL